MSYDGLVSRHLNRRLSRPAARAVAGTGLTPNHATLITLASSIVVSVMLALGWSIAGGIGIQLVSVMDGVDGELARLKQMSTKFGALLDAVTDRYADAFMMSGMTVCAVRFEDWSHAGVVGLLALGGSLAVSYSRARIEASLDVAPSDGLLGLASRDVRSLVLAVGAVMGQCYWALALVAVMTTATVAWRLAYLRVTGTGMTPNA